MGSPWFERLHWAASMGVYEILVLTAVTAALLANLWFSAPKLNGFWEACISTSELPAVSYATGATAGDAESPEFHVKDLDERQVEPVMSPRDSGPLGASTPGEAMARSFVIELPDDEIWVSGSSAGVDAAASAMGKRLGEKAWLRHAAPDASESTCATGLVAVPGSDQSAEGVPVTGPEGDAAHLSCGRLVDLSGTYNRRSFQVPATGVLIGRSPYVSEIVLSNRYISARHAWIGFVKGRPVLRDLNSTNGTYLNQDRVLPETDSVLHSGDKISFGHCHAEQFQFLFG